MRPGPCGWDVPALVGSPLRQRKPGDGRLRLGQLTDCAAMSEGAAAGTQQEQGELGAVGAECRAEPVEDLPFA